MWSLQTYGTLEDSNITVEFGYVFLILILLLDFLYEMSIDINRNQLIN